MRARAVIGSALALGLLCSPLAAAQAQQASGTIATVAGTGAAGRTGDGGPAVAAAVGHPRGIAALPNGGFLFAEPFNNTVRLVRADGRISTVAGTGVAGFSGDGGSATAARLNFVHGVAAMPDGGFVVADMLNNRIRRVRPDGTITTVAGNGEEGFSGDGGPATQAALNLPRGLATRPSGEILIADTSNDRVRRVAPNGTITTVATGLGRPFGVAPLPGGAFLVAERLGNRVRRVLADGTMTTVAGTGVREFSGDGGPATAAGLNEPHAVIVVPGGGFLIADTHNHRVRRVHADGTITTLSGAGVEGYSGDGGLATAAWLDHPKALAATFDGRAVLVGDAENNRVRLVIVDLRPPLVLRLLARTLRARAGTPATLSFTVSRPARVEGHVRRQGRLVTRVAMRATTGRNRLALRRLLPGRYTVQVVARATDGRTASGRASLSVVP